MFNYSCGVFELLRFFRFQWTIHLGPVRFIVRTAGAVVMVNFTIICFQSRVLRKLIANFHIEQVVTFGYAKKFVASYN